MLNLIQYQNDGNIFRSPLQKLMSNYNTFVLCGLKSHKKNLCKLCGKIRKSNYTKKKYFSFMNDYVYS